MMTKSNQLDFSTRCIHAGQEPDPTTGAVMMPIYTTSTYVQQSPGVNKGYDYARTKNPTRMAFERCIADLEGGSAAFAFAARSRPRSSASTMGRISLRSTTSTAARGGCSSECASARWDCK
jgi:cystathionine beta-lyase/cystathionine gamma-synthase